MGKCDVIIPVYKSPEWVKMCVYAVFKNTDADVLNKVILVNDCDDELTINCLNNLNNKYGKKIEIITNERNLGFVGTTNNGLKASTSDYVLLLNTDCILSENAIEKMINNIKNDPTIGLVCPVSSNAANLTLEMFPGFNFSDMNKLLEKKFKGKLFDVCTVVGNCLLITRKCLNEVGLLDTAYGLGYGEETDYQFSAMAKGFKAKVSIDTYVFHKSEASFGTSKEKQERLKKNRDLFFSRWGKEYNLELSKYEKNDPIKYILNNISNEDKKVSIDTAFYLDGIVQNAGGVHVVVDIVNYLAINGCSTNIIYSMMGEYKEIMLFNPIPVDKMNSISVNKLVATIWSSCFIARKLADEIGCKLLYFVQGNECLFENSSIYGMVETSYKLADSHVTISNYLKDYLKDTHNIDATLINNGVNVDLLYKKNTDKVAKTITFVFRNSVMKGDWILADIIKKLDCKAKDLTFNIVYMNSFNEFPQIENNKSNLYLGPLSRKEIISLLQHSDIYVDASLSEGFGLTPLEAIVSGNIVVTSNSLGNVDYMIDGENGFLIDKVNNPDKYVEKILDIVNDKKLFNQMKNNNSRIINEFDNDVIIDKYIDYFINTKFKEKKIVLNEYDKKVYELRTSKKEIKAQTTKKRKVYYVSKLIPKPIKRFIKKIVKYLYNCYNH